MRVRVNWLARLATVLSLLLVTPGALAVTLAEALAAAVQLQPGAEGAAQAAQAKSLFAADPSLNLQHFNDGIGSDDGAREWEAGMAALGVVPE